MNAVYWSDSHLSVPCTDARFWEMEMAVWNPSMAGAAEPQPAWTLSDCEPDPRNSRLIKWVNTDDGSRTEMKGLMGDNLVLKAEN